MISRVYKNLSRHITALKRKLSKPKYLCPICLSPMHDRPVSYNICPTCYTEFEYDDEHRSVAQQWYIRYNATDGFARGLEIELERSAERIRSFEKLTQLKEEERRRYIYDSEQSVKQYGLKPGELQWKWRSNPPDVFDYNEAEAAVIDALCREGIPAWSGDATGCVTQIVEAVYKKIVTARKHIATLEEDNARLKESVKKLEKRLKFESERLPEAQADSKKWLKILYGMEPGELQNKWRTNPPDIFDSTEASRAVIDALVQERIVAWSGDGVSIVAQIIEAVYKKLESYRSAAYSFLKYVKRGYAIREHQATCFDCSAGLDCHKFLELLEKEDAALEEALTAAKNYEQTFVSKH